MQSFVNCHVPASCVNGSLCSRTDATAHVLQRETENCFVYKEKAENLFCGLGPVHLFAASTVPCVRESIHLFP